MFSTSLLFIPKTLKVFKSNSFSTISIITAPITLNTDIRTIIIIIMDTISFSLCIILNKVSFNSSCVLTERELNLDFKMFLIFTLSSDAK